MIKQFERLSEEEAELVFQAPVLMSVAAAWGSQEYTQAGEEEALKLAHFKTITAVPLLLSYYKHVELTFNEDFAAAMARYAPFDEEKHEELLAEVNLLNKAISKLEKKYAHALHLSLTGYADHVKKAGRGILASFVFPVPITGLSD